MESTITCPHCNGQLRINEHIIFATRNSHKESGLIILSSKVGDYSVLKHDTYDFEPKEQVEFFCPLCQKNLVSDIHPNLCVVKLNDSRGSSYNIYFSNIVGEKCTYVVSEDTFEAHGKDSALYLNYFNH